MTHRWNFLQIRTKPIIPTTPTNHKTYKEESVMPEKAGIQKSANPSRMDCGHATMTRARKSVMPTKAGIQKSANHPVWIVAYATMTRARKSVMPEKAGIQKSVNPSSIDSTLTSEEKFSTNLRFSSTLKLMLWCSGLFASGLCP